jgi:hypothetical protein
VAVAHSQLVAVAHSQLVAVAHSQPLKIPEIGQQYPEIQQLSDSGHQHLNNLKTLPAKSIQTSSYA